jgi:dedicated sortase system histidine kinase
VNTIAASVRDRPELLYSDVAQIDAASQAQSIYAHRLTTAPRIDGYRDDWGRAGTSMQTFGSPEQRYWAATDGRYVYLFFSISDADLRYETPDEGPGDRIFLGLRANRAQTLRPLVLATAAPGILGARLADGDLVPTSNREDRVFGSWVETSQGFDVEVRLPVELARYGLGLGYVDVGPADRRQVSTSGNWLTGESPGPLKFAQQPLENQLTELRAPGARLRVVDLRGFVLADLGTVSTLAQPDQVTLVDRFYRFILSSHDESYGSFDQEQGRLAAPELERALGGEPGSWWLRSPGSASAIVLAAAPVTHQDRVIGAVLVEQASEGILTLTNRALTRLMNATLLASLVAALSLLSFATLLSFRVRRLARATRRALGPRGEIETRLPGRGAGDELGDLARSFGDLLGRLDAYTGYLRSLSGKLSHELRTPIAVVTTSAENLEAEITSESARVFLKRLRNGAVRLEHIVSSMSEATRIEQAIADTQRTPFRLAGLVEQAVQSYRSIHTDYRISFSSDDKDSQLLGSPELIAQMLDKLIDNAVEFTSPGGRIEVRLRSNREGGWALTVANEGPPLPADMGDQLFDSLVSVRSGKTEQPHLGLGLFIVRLIAEFHGGRVEARSSEDPRGCAFSVFLPPDPQAS